jgi:hypothetical protein
VLERYIKYCSARLDGIGGDSSAVPPSLTWTPPLPGEQGGKPSGRGHALCGKVCEVVFDCHGELEGFVLESCCKRHRIECRARGIAELVLRAARDNLTVCVRRCADGSAVESLTIEV